MCDTYFIIMLTANKIEGIDMGLI